MNPIALIGIGIAAIYLLGKSQTTAAIRAVKVIISDVSVGCSGFLCTQPIIQLKLSIQNPTDRDILVKSLSGSIFLNDQYVGNVSSFNNAPIAANASTPYPIEVQASATQTLRTLADMLTGQTGLHVKLRLEGTINADNLLIPITVTQNVF